MNIDTLGTVKMKMDDWCIRKLYEHIDRHSLWHYCPGDAYPWLVCFGREPINGEYDPDEVPQWRCCKCYEQPPEGILGAYILLESDFCAARVQDEVNNKP